MTYNQKLVSLMTVFLLGTTAAVVSTCFECPFSDNFKIALGFIFFAEFVFGAFWVQQIGKADSVLPLSLGVWAVNLVYLVWVFVVIFFMWLETKYFFLVQVVGLSLFVVAHLFFRIVERHIEEMAKDDEPEQKIERAKVTWR